MVGLILIAIQQLVELGYIEAPDANVEEAVQQTVKELQYNLARSYIGANHHAEAIPILEELWETYPDEGRFGVNLLQSFLELHNLPSLYLRIGELYLAQKNWRQSDSHFYAVLELDPVNAEAHLGLARSHLKQGRYELAVQEAMAALGLIYYNPQAHFICGVALYRCGQIADAMKALETAINQNPVFPIAYRYLGFIYSKHFTDGEKANQYRKLAKESLQKTSCESNLIINKQ